mmetsp:Transcript_247/g.508  ORF Transcript_247/g.508 Transcript_247/m.508 type:complete len:98 (-) Transcript_247:332-625(-)
MIGFGKELDDYHDVIGRQHACMHDDDPFGRRTSATRFNPVKRKLHCLTEMGGRNGNDDLKKRNYNSTIDLSLGGWDIVEDLERRRQFKMQLTGEAPS